MSPVDRRSTEDVDDEEDDWPRPPPLSSQLNHINLWSEVISRAERRANHRNSAVYDSELYINSNPIPAQIRNIFDMDVSTESTSTADNGNDNLSDGEELSYNEEDSEIHPPPPPPPPGPDSDGLRSDIQSNEHLLLSSARQNPTNTNTLISHGGIPIRRSNAIRSRQRQRLLRHSEQSSLQPGSTSLANNSNSTVLAAVSVPPPLPSGPPPRLPTFERAHRHLRSQLQLYFPNNSSLSFMQHHTHPDIQQQSSGPPPPRRKPPSLNEAKKMCRTMQLIVKDLQATKLSNGPSPLFVSKSHKHRSVFGKPLEPSDIEAAFDCLKTRSYQSMVGGATSKRNVQKRVTAPTIEGTSIKVESNKKRKTTAHSENEMIIDGPLYYKSNGTGCLDLTEDNIGSIMDGMYSSYLRGGINYTLNGGYPCELSFTSVDYDSNGIYGHFVADTSMGDYIRNTARFFAGGAVVPPTRRLARFKGMARNRAISKKLELLEYYLAHSEPKTSHKPLHIPVRGQIVDFQENGLTFLPKLQLNVFAGETRSGKQYWRHYERCTHADRTMVQLSEWTKIQPFKEFEEAYLYKEAREIYRDLKSHLKELPSLHTTVKNANSDEPPGSSTTIPRPLLSRQQLAKRRLLVDAAGGVNCAYVASNIESTTSSSRHSISKISQGFNEKLLVRLTECLTCKDHCLANVQLNYLLFTITVDVGLLLDELISRAQVLCEEEVVRKGKSIHQVDSGPTTSGNNDPDGDSRATFLCSINRKTGQIDLHNTRAYLEYTDIYRGDSSMSTNLPPGTTSTTPPTSSRDLDVGDNMFESVFSGISLGGASIGPEEDYDHATLYDGLGVYTSTGFRDPYLHPDFHTTLTGNVRKRCVNSTFSMV
ncbi:hypothetical protein CAAN1_04S03026 [[Candida] anglica]|uniref:Uncharacterized protein n=1 Tax=[Candida] anglica TaxID=148631 RepID=A0ABP0EAQ9_9ASCO